MIKCLTTMAFSILFLPWVRCTSLAFYWVESTSNYAKVEVLLGYPYLVRRCYDVLSLSWAP
jgi:hypothetical protein